MNYYIKTAFRNIIKHKTNFVLNLLSLVIGITCFITIILWMNDEFQHDRFLPDSDDIHYALANLTFNDEIQTWSHGSYRLFEEVKSESADVEQVEMISSGQWPEYFKKNNGIIKGTFREVSKGYFELLQYPFLLGNRANCLEQPSNIVITDKFAEKFYGENWASLSLLDSTLTNNRNGLYTIAGVIKDYNHLSSIKGDIFALYEKKEWDDSWGNFNHRVIIKLGKRSSLADFNNKIKDIYDRKRDDGNHNSAQIFFQPYKNKYLYSKYKNGQQAGGRIAYIRIFGIAALFILLIACINFINMSTARFANRNREIGLRKTLGATKTSIVLQFLGEALLIAFFATVVAVAISELLFPILNVSLNKKMQIPYYEPIFWLCLIGIAGITGILAGLYPALVLSSINIQEMFKKTWKRYWVTTFVRKGLVSFQFVLSVLLIIVSIGIFKQIEFIRNKNIGYDKEHLLMHIIGGDLDDKYSIIKEELQGQIDIENVSSSSINLFSIGSKRSGFSWEEKDFAETEHISFSGIYADYDFIETLGVKLLSGRTHQRERASDSLGVVINQQAADLFGFDDPIGKTFTDSGEVPRTYTIIGIVDDVYLTSYHTAVEPLIIICAPENTWNMFIRSKKGQLAEAIKSTEKILEKYNIVYEGELVDQQFEQHYKNDIFTGKFAWTLTILAILISCLGLLGLAHFTLKRREKEVAVRKILGASIWELTQLLSTSFLKPILIGIVIAIPLAMLFLQDWLTNFAYTVDLGVGIYMMGSLIAICIAILTIGYQILQVAIKNPAESLKTE